MSLSRDQKLKRHFSCTATAKDISPCRPFLRSDTSTDSGSRRVVQFGICTRYNDFQFRICKPFLCVQTPADVDRLVEEENVGAIICLQQDPDLAYFSLDLGAIQKRCAERKDVEHIRSPIR